MTRGYGRSWSVATRKLVMVSGALIGLVAAVGLRAGAQVGMSNEAEPIRYLTAPVDDPIARLQARIDRGEVSLRFDRDQGYLPAVLEALEVPVESQGLVFSKTSFQSHKISPRSPRAIFFNDDVYIGWVRGGDMLEIASIDPNQGTVFYLLDQAPTESPTFERETHSCLSCHESGRTQDVPGVLVRSVYPLADGTPAYNGGTFLSGHESPLNERWGGWYVTGTHGDQHHMGNALVRDRDHPEELDRAAGANVTDLEGRFASAAYPAPHSDIVALMVLEHQTQMHNRLTAANYETRRALHYQAGIEKAFGPDKSDAMLESVRRRIDRAAEDVLRYLLFVDEAPLTAPIEGTSGFAAVFAALGPSDPRGRSLRDLDLERRLFRYPCSYLIYSEQFDALPVPVRSRIGRRLIEILGGEGASTEFDHLGAEDRGAILDILQATKPELFDGPDATPAPAES